MASKSVQQKQRVARSSLISQLSALHGAIEMRTPVLRHPPVIQPYVDTSDLLVFGLVSGLGLMLRREKRSIQV